MRKWILFITISLIMVSTALFAAGGTYLLNIQGAIGPATVDYVKRGIAIASKNHAQAIILQLNTPGGLESATRAINEAIIASPIPIISYVAPSGARAASAGTFIMYASHYAAMAPGTNIGAASPVEIGGNHKATTLDKKAVNDAAAYMRSLAALHHRNAAWGEKAVTDAVSLSAEEAKRLHVIDDIANDKADLMNKINGKTFTVRNQNQTVQTKNVDFFEVKQDWRYDFLSFITNPNIAYILMLLAIYGLFFELSNPGMVLPGVVGVIALLLMLYAFQLMPVNYVGLTLILIGIAFLIFEVFVSSFGILGLGGVIAFIIGSIMLFDVNDPNYQITWTLIFAMSGVTVAFFFVLLTLAIRSHKKEIVTGKEALIGSQGMVYSIMNEQIVVQVLGEMWEARSLAPLKEGQHVKVIGVNGLTLEVEPVKEIK